MKFWTLHAVFAIILVGSLGARERAGDVLSEGDGLEPAVAVIRVARSHGLVFRRYMTIADTDVRALVFESPGCSQPVLAILLSGAFDQDMVSRSPRE